MSDPLDAILSPTAAPAPSAPANAAASVDPLDAILAPASAPQMKGGTAGDTALGYIKGLTLGLAPYIGAAGDTVRGYLGANNSTDYGTNLKVQKIVYDQAQKESPTAFALGQAGGAVTTGLAGGGAATTGARALGLSDAAAPIVGNTVSNVAQGATSGAANAAPGQAAEGAKQGATVAALWSTLGAGPQALFKMVGPSNITQALQQRIASAASGDAVERQAFKQFFNASSYDEAMSIAKDQLAAADKLRQTILGGVNATARAGSTVAGGVAGYNGAQAMGQNPLAGAALGAAAGYGGETQIAKATNGITRLAPMVAPAAPAVGAAGTAVTNTALQPTSNSQPVHSGLGDLIDRFRNWTGLSQ